MILRVRTSSEQPARCISSKPERPSKFVPFPCPYELEQCFARDLQIAQGRVDAVVIRFCITKHFFFLQVPRQEVVPFPSEYPGSRLRPGVVGSDLCPVLPFQVKTCWKMMNPALERHLTKNIRILVGREATQSLFEAGRAFKDRLTEQRKWSLPRLAEEHDEGRFPIVLGKFPRPTPSRHPSTSPAKAAGNPVLVYFLDLASQ